MSQGISSRSRIPGLLAALLCLVAAGGAGATGYAESSSGDLSGDRFSPTRLVLDYSTSGNVPGSNVVSGTTGRANGVVDRDYLNVVVPAGFRLSELRVGNQTMVGGGGSFIGLASGAVMPVAPDAADATGLLGYRIYGTGDRNTDILDDMSPGGNGATGFVAPLPAGDYTVWVQELAPGSFGYRFNFVLTPVPEPSSILLCSLGLVALAALRRRFAPLA